jgi:DNA-binding NarL/FixJ family response regulator
MMSEIERYQNSAGDEDAAGDTIVLAHRVQLWRDSLTALLEFESYAVLPFPTLASWLDVRSKFPPPSVVLLCQPDQRELALVAKVAKEVATVVIADFEGGPNFTQLLSDGVRGIIPTSTAFNVALNAIRLAESGGTFVPADLLSRKESRNDFGYLLTERQIDVVEALRQGKANKQIAHDLNLRESTVKVHIRQIMRKLDARNRTEIAVLANELLELNRAVRDGD